jgi:hypothetical protein
MAEAGQDLGLVLEASQGRAGGDSLLHDLEGHRPPGVLLDRLVHHAHAPGRDHPLDVIVADLVRDLRRHVVVGQVGGAGPDTRLGVDGLGFRVEARILWIGHGSPRECALIYP